MVAIGICPNPVIQLELLHQMSEFVDLAQLYMEVENDHVATTIRAVHHKQLDTRFMDTLLNDHNPHYNISNDTRPISKHPNNDAFFSEEESCPTELINSSFQVV